MRLESQSEAFSRDTCDKVIYIYIYIYVCVCVCVCICIYIYMWTPVSVESVSAVSVIRGLPRPEKKIWKIKEKNGS